MTTTDLTAYQPRIDALCRATEGRVSVQLELWYRLHCEPRVEWTVYLVNSAENGQKVFEGVTLEQALANAEYACDLGDTPAPTVVLP